MNPITWVQGLDGTTLIVVICVLMFVEETGVPLPFAPGDLVLAIGGISVAAGRVNPVFLVSGEAISVTIGALIGRAVAELLGWERLMRIAQPLHARGPLERAAGLLQRGGWRTVFTARLIPGLRVYTTQVAGVSRVPLRTYVAGLLPAHAGYIHAFVGLGAALGRLDRPPPIQTRLGQRHADPRQPGPQLRRPCDRDDPGTAALSRFDRDDTGRCRW